jgi:RHS repeat-associated protein
MAYNQRGRPTEVTTDPDKPSKWLKVNLTYDAFGNVTRRWVTGADIASRTTTTTYDARGHYPTSVTNALGHVSRVTAYDWYCGLATATTDPNGLMSRVEYDQFCRKIKETRPDGNSTVTSYLFDAPDSNGYRSYSVLTKADGGGTNKAYFDFLGRNYSNQYLVLDKTYQIIIKQDRFGRVIKKNNPNLVDGFYDDPYDDGVGWTSYQLDDLDRVVRITDPAGKISTVSYNGLTTVHTNPNNQSRTEITDHDDQTIKTIDALGSAILYAYDASANLLKTTDQAGNTIEISYNDVDQKISMDDPDMGVWRYSSNALGQLISQTDAKNQTITSSYDLLGRLVSRTTPDGVSSWVYDTAPNGKGKLYSESGPEADYRKYYHYDFRSRPSQVDIYISGARQRFYQDYDGYSRPHTVTYPYDIKITNNYSTDSGMLIGKNVRHAAYNLNWRMDKTTAAGQAMNEDIDFQIFASQDDVNISTNRNYDSELFRLTSISNDVTKTIHVNGFSRRTIETAQGLSFTWDAIGNLTQRKNLMQPNHVDDFQYDALNRLTSTVTDGVTKNVAYDLLGNITYKSDVGTYQYGTGGTRPHAVSSIDTSTATDLVSQDIFDPSGGYQYDNNGNITSGGSRTIQWTSFNKPVQMSDADGSQISYQYGPGHQRIFKQAHSGDTVKSTTYFSKSFKREAVVENGTALPIQYRVTIPLGTVNMEWIIEAGQLQDQQFLLTDHLGSTSVILDKDGNVKEKLSFDPWGLRRNSDWTPPTEKITSASPTGYTGHEMDDEMSLVNMNARIYDPVLGRFLSPDSVLPDASNMQAFNRYAYVNNNPLSGTDPTGHVTAPSYAYYLENRKSLYYNESRSGNGWNEFYKNPTCHTGNCKHAGYESYATFARRTLIYAAGSNPDGTMISRREANRRNHAAQDRARNIAGCPTCTGSQLYGIAFDGASHNMTASQFDAFKNEIEASYYLRLYSQMITRKRQIKQWGQGIWTIGAIAMGGGFDSWAAFGGSVKGYAVNAGINAAGAEIGVSNLSTWVNIGRSGFKVYDDFKNPDLGIQNLSVVVAGNAESTPGKGGSISGGGWWNIDSSNVGGVITKSDTTGFGAAAGINIDILKGGLENIGGESTTNTWCLLVACVSSHSNTAGDWIGGGISIGPAGPLGGSFVNSENLAELYDF